jgi:hypothetical protein
MENTMAETVVAASSPAEMEDPFKGQNVSFDEFSKFRLDGELPERFKPATADSEPAAAPEETVDDTENAPDSDPEDAQEQPPKTPEAAKRIKQLLAEKKELERKLEEAAKKDGKTESSPAPAPQPTARVKPKPEDTDSEGKPKYKTYEEYGEALAAYIVDERLEAAEKRQAEQKALETLKGKLDEARTRYEDADRVIFPTAQAIQAAKIPPIIKDLFAKSDLYPHLCYVVGSDPEELKGFVSLAQTSPRAALAKLFEYERGITEELAKGATAAEDGKAPEPKRTSAPKPPTPVGGGSSRAFDVSDESLSADEWARRRNAQINLRKKG